jgi:DNA processing protein
VATAPRPAPVVWRRGAPPYPPALNDLPDPPATLYSHGAASILAAPVVTIVGSRRATAYGERIAHSLATAFARAGVCVLSGLAYGIDVTALRAAQKIGGRTCGVLGTGLDVVYPLSHGATQDACGLLLSEYAPGTTPRHWHFPQRNRLMAALGHATIVIEAGATSGALLTAQVALDLGRPVGALPGPIDSPMSAGTNDLLSRPGVMPIADVAAALSLVGATVAESEPRRLAPDERVIWDALPAVSVDDLVARTALPTPRCLAAIASLELARALTVGYDGTIYRAERGDIST